MRGLRVVVAGVPGRGGQPPKAQNRRGGRKPAVESRKVAASSSAKAPRADAAWHPAAKRFYAACKSSGQVALYQPSDWMTLVVLVELMSRAFYADEAPSAATITAWSKVMDSLLLTESARQKARVVLEQPEPSKPDVGDVAWLADARRRLQGPDA